MPIVLDGLVAYYNGKQNSLSSPQLEDLSGNGLHATVSGATLQGDGSFYFDGVDDRIVLPVMDAQTAYTIEAWVSYVATRSAHAIICFGSSNNGVRVDSESGGTLANIRVIQNGQSRSGANSGVDMGGIMAHYVVRYDPDTKEAERFLNGNQLSSLEYLADMVFNEGPATIGATNTTSNSNLLLGMLGALRLYNRPLTDQELDQNRAVGVEVGLDDGGVDATAIFNFYQTIYADTLQSVALGQSIYRHVDNLGIVNLQIYADRAYLSDMEQHLYADRQELAYSLQVVYADQLEVAYWTTNIYEDVTAAAAIHQLVYDSTTAIYPLEIKIVPPQNVYRQVVHLDFDIQQQMIIDANITRSLNMDFKI